MNDERKPYEADWPYGYETRDGRKAELVGETLTCLVWRIAGTETLLLAGHDGDAPYNDCIFCTPAPVPERLERWVNTYRDGRLFLYNSEAEANKIKSPDHVIRALHLREVRPGDMTAEAVQAVIDVLREESVNTHSIAMDRAYQDAANRLFRASRGEA